MSTDEEFDLELIKLIRKRKCLYEAKSRRCENIEKRLVEWQTVGATLGKPVPFCKRRWSSLRDRFVREKRKVELGRVKPGNEWEFYNEMKFILPYVKYRNAQKVFLVKGYKNLIKHESPLDFDDTNNTIDEEEEEDTQSFVSENLSFSEPFDVKPETLQQIHHIKSHESDESNEHISVDDDCYDFKGRPSASSSSMDKKPFKNYNTMTSITSTSKGFVPDSNTANAALLELINSITTEIKKVIHEEKDETDLFLDFMGMQMKKLSAISKLKIQTEFMQRITEELIKES